MMLVIRQKYLWILGMKRLEFRMFLFKLRILCFEIAHRVRMGFFNARFFFRCLRFELAKSYLLFLIGVQKLFGR